MGRMVGIDLGTTNSVVAIVDGPTPRVLDNREAKSHTRSVVGLKKRRGRSAADPPEILIGDTAYDNLEMAPQDTIISIKRLMGRGVSDLEVQKLRQTVQYKIVEPSDGTSDSVRVLLGGAEHSPIDISAMILQKLKADAEFRLGEPVTHAVVTVPAYFTQIQRDATRRAGLKAGLRVTKILEEPTAAAIAFGVETGDGTPKTVLVFDLGGGTFDISVLMWAGNVFAPLNLEGDMWLGGDNLDQVIVDHATAYVMREFGVDPTANVRFMAALKRAAQAVKERLSSATSADLLVTGILQDESGNLLDLDLEITRDEFERMIVPMVGRYRRCACGQANLAGDTRCAKCAQPLQGAPVEDGRAVQLVRKALQHPNVNMTPEQIDYVIMAGNATSVPLVQQTMAELFGADRILRKMHPKHSVAIGAAIVAAWQGSQAICQAPDPGDPKRECGQINPDDARKCSRCGAPLEPDANRAAEGAKAGAPQKVGQIGGIAPVHYGAQTVGDRFNIFVHKGDPYPTDEPHAQIFRTLTPKQRMISIPIFGGDNVERASANEKQGEAFAVLPSDLPQMTPIRIKVWLDSDAVFKVSAHLDDGTDLKPWVVKGEQDAKVIRGIQEVDKLLADDVEQLRADDRRELEEARRGVFDKLRRHEFSAAERDVQRMEDLRVRAVAAPSQQAQAEGLASWTDYVLQQYGWCLDPAYGQRLADLNAALRAAMRSGDVKKIGDAYAPLNALADQLSDPAYTFMSIRYAAGHRVRNHDPAASADLLRRLEGVEHAWRRGAPDAADQVRALVDAVSHALQQLAGARLGRCSAGHEMPKGERLCPVCGEDTWGLQSGPTTSALRRDVAT